MAPPTDRRTPPRQIGLARRALAPSQTQTAGSGLAAWSHGVQQHRATSVRATQVGGEVRGGKGGEGKEGKLLHSLEPRRRSWPQRWMIWGSTCALSSQLDLSSRGSVEREARLSLLQTGASRPPGEAGFCRVENETEASLPMRSTGPSHMNSTSVSVEHAIRMSATQNRVQPKRETSSSLMSP